MKIHEHAYENVKVNDLDVGATVCYMMNEYVSYTIMKIQIIS